jgi:siroheme synthase
MITMNIEQEMKKVLPLAVVRVNFTKANSTETRTMICTQLPELMPKAKGTGKRKDNPGLCVVGRIAQYDNESEEIRPIEFRSFYLQNVNWYEVIHDCQLD